jgi:ATP-dependent Clp protease protease subunit
MGGLGCPVGFGGARAMARHHTFKLRPFTLKTIRATDDEDDLEEVTLLKVSDFEEVKFRDLVERGLVWLCGEINKRSARRVITSLMWALNKGSQPIFVFLSTPGGDVDAALALYDTIKGLVESGVGVNTVAVGECFSAGTVVLQAGLKRFITPNTYLMIHEISSWNLGKVSEQLETAHYLKEYQDRVFRILAERSKLGFRAIKKRCLRRNWWLPPEDVLKYGFADDLLDYRQVVALGNPNLKEGGVFEK